MKYQVWSCAVQITCFRSTVSTAVLAASALAASSIVAVSEPAGPFDCLIEPSAVVELSAQAQGIVAELLVDRGDRVRKGQLVARLQDTAERANLAIAVQRAKNEAGVRLKEARLRFEDRRSERNAGLITNNIVTAKEADEIRTARDLAYWELKEAEEQAALARLQVDVAEAEVKTREVRSTVDGVVMERNRDPGENASGAYILKIAQLDPLFVETFVPVTQLPRLKPGARVEIRGESLANRVMQGTVDVVDRVADAASGMMKVRVRVANEGYGEFSGLRCSAIMLD